MGRLRGHTRLAVLVLACAVVAGGVIAGLALTGGGHEHTTLTKTTGQWAPISVTRPNVPIVGGGIAVDIDPIISRTDLSTTIASLPATNSYRITISNTSSVGVINSLQWYPPTGVSIVKVIDSTKGHCVPSGLTGFGGNQFRTVVLNPNILCDKLALKPPTCTCLGNGGAVSISFVTDSDISGTLGEAKMVSATLVFKRIPSYIK
jgi:hypothetical protein